MTIPKLNGAAGRVMLSLGCALLGSGGGYAAAVSRLVTPAELKDAIDDLSEQRDKAVKEQQATMRAELLNEIGNRTLDKSTLERWRGEQDANFKAISADLRAVQEQQIRTNTILELKLPDIKMP